MKIPLTVTQSFMLTRKELEEAVRQYLDIMPRDDSKVTFSWKHGSRLEGYGPSETDTPYFDGVEVTIKP